VLIIKIKKKVLLAKMEENNYKTRDTIIIIFYFLIFLLSLCGNLLVLKVVQKRATTTNILIGCLAISDLLITVLNILFNVARFISLNWPFGETMCVLVPFVQVA